MSLPVATVVPLLSGHAAQSAGSPKAVNTGVVRGMYGLVQVKITGVATVDIEGRINSSFPWKTITSFTGSDASEIVLFPEMRANVSSYSSGTVDAAIVAN